MRNTNKRKKNVALFISTLSAGGAERTVSYLSTYLKKKYNIYLFLFHDNNIAYKFEGKLVNLNIYPTSNKFLKIFNFFKNIRKLKLLKKRFKIDLTISFMEDANFLNVLSKTGDIVICSQRRHIDRSHMNLRVLIINFLRIICYKNADLIIALSNGVKKEIEKTCKINKNKIKVIYNGCDLRKILHLKEENLDINPVLLKNPILINVARFNRVKGHKELIKSFYLVTKKIKNAKLILIGEGPLLNEVKFLVKKLKLEGNVLFLGAQQNPFKFLNISDLFLLSSYSEGFGNVLLEAMVCGVPIITTNCPSGPKEILSPNRILDFTNKKFIKAEFGVFVRNFISKRYTREKKLSYYHYNFAYAIVKLLNSNEDRAHYSKVGFLRASEFDIAEIYKKWVKIIDEKLN